MINKEKMSIEEIKKYLWCEQIKNVIRWSINGFYPNCKIYKPEIWHLQLWRGNVKCEPTGWSRTTFNKRWVQLVNEGYITEERPMSGHIRIDDIHELIEKVHSTMNALKIGDNWCPIVMRNMTFEEIYKEYY